MNIFKNVNHLKMSIINSVLGLFLGNKYERDLKEINPYVEKTHIEFDKLRNLSNDSLRDLTDELQRRDSRKCQG